MHTISLVCCRYSNANIIQLNVFFAHVSNRAALHLEKLSLVLDEFRLEPAEKDSWNLATKEHIFSVENRIKSS